MTSYKLVGMSRAYEEGNGGRERMGEEAKRGEKREWRIVESRSLSNVLSAERGRLQAVPRIGEGWTSGDACVCV